MDDHPRDRSPAAAPAQVEAELRPHRSLGPLGFQILMARIVRPG